MKAQVRTLWLPKAGNTPKEYEDAFYPGIEVIALRTKDKPLEEHCDTFRPKNDIVREGKFLPFAISDGATEGAFSRRWAELLVVLLSKWDILEIDYKKFLERAYDTWNKWKNRYIYLREKQNRPVQWFEEEGLQTGAFSTFLGLTLRDSEDELPGKWDAIALGDSCLFQVRCERLITKFPMEHSSQFNNQPLLFSSNPAKNNDVLENMKKIEGDWHIDDQFYLMTDALATWFLREYDLGKTPWKIMCSPEISDKQQRFEEWIGELRVNKQIRNDDVTLILINII